MRLRGIRFRLRWRRLPRRGMRGGGVLGVRRNGMRGGWVGGGGGGYEGVEVLADKPHWYRGVLDAGEAAALRQELGHLGLAVSNVNANCTFGYFKEPPGEAFFEPSLISPDPKMRADRIRMIQNTL